MYMSMLSSFLLNISVTCSLSNYFSISDLLCTHWTDFPGSLYLGLLLSLYIFPGRRKASHFRENISPPGNHALYEFITKNLELTGHKLSKIIWRDSMFMSGN